MDDPDRKDPSGEPEETIESHIVARWLSPVCWGHLALEFWECCS